ncbi:MAG: hypothetical protein OEQ74_01565 [Gammaproteobacteria bacterium]|nr:hypothetical protein [Gammaproteobacteria bacterium]
MNWIILVACCVFFVEAFVRLRFLQRVGELNALLHKVARTIRSSRISDHWKERVIPRYAITLFLMSIKLFAILLTTMSAFFVAAIVSGLAGGEFGGLIVSFSGIIASTIIVFAYATLRKRFLA